MGRDLRVKGASRWVQPNRLLCCRHQLKVPVYFSLAEFPLTPKALEKPSSPRPCLLGFHETESERLQRQRHSRAAHRRASLRGMKGWRGGAIGGRPREHSDWTGQYVSVWLLGPAPMGSSVYPLGVGERHTHTRREIGRASCRERV